MASNTRDITLELQDGNEVQLDVHIGSSIEEVEFLAEEFCTIVRAAMGLSQSTSLEEYKVEICDESGRWKSTSSKLLVYGRVVGNRLRFTKVAQRSSVTNSSEDGSRKVRKLQPQKVQTVVKKEIKKEKRDADDDELQWTKHPCFEEIMLLAKRKETGQALDFEGEESDPEPPAPKIAEDMPARKKADFEGEESDPESPAHEKPDKSETNAYELQCQAQRSKVKAAKDGLMDRLLSLGVPEELFSTKAPASTSKGVTSGGNTDSRATHADPSCKAGNDRQQLKNPRQRKHQQQQLKSGKQHLLGSKKHHYRGTDDTDRLSELVVQLRTEFQSGGLDLAPFDLDDRTTPPLWLSRRLMGSSMTSWPSSWSGTLWLTPGFGEHAALRYPAGVDPQPILAREQRLVRDNRASDWRPTDETHKLSLYNRLDPIFYAAVKVRYPLAGDLGGVTLRSLQALVVAIFQAWAQSDDGAAAGEKQVLGADGKPSALVTSSEYTVLLEEIAALKALVRGGRAGGGQQPQPQHRGKQHPRGFRVGAGNPPAVGFDRDSMKAKPLCHRCRKAGKGEVFQDAADIGPEAFSHAALAYGPPAVLSTDGVGGIDVAAYGFSVPPPPSGGTDDEDILRRLDALTSEVQAAQDKVHFTHASFIPGSGAEGHASALVCGPAAAVGITPEGQVPAGGAAASASAVPAPAMPVSQVKDVEPAPTQSARVTTTEATCGEFGGFVQTVNHAAVHPSDLTGYDTDDYEDFADGTFAVKPRAPAGTVGCGVPPFGFGKPAIGALAVLSLFCISFAGVAVSASTASAVSAYASATEVPSPGGDLDWETPSFYFTNDFVDSVNPAQGFLLAHDVPPLQPPEPPDTVSLLAFQDLSQADLGIGMAYYYGMALHESGPLDVEHYYGAGFFTSYYEPCL
ncbi:hypothetical protein CYMTET_47094 [Cymbomonas tetramitiformis]|uniref:Uncharacterized protein n=1 Tax=Cymbomonas tetramitiformis TaxID=36881 RepID=A0AAE0BW24_9CHLO|nr:hypothetical protein CYMTET_47094 [Cymbomonas tetramitiformis]